MNAQAPRAPRPVNRIMIVAVTMLSTIMVALDQTIANVALPHMAGSVSASQDQIGWVLTSYIVMGAIFTPLTGWLTNRVGRRKLFLFCVIGFMATSALCGAAQNLAELVGFRLLQGAIGAPLVPMSQALLLDLFTLRERGPAMSIWGVGVMVAPIVGPVLGGWLTDTLDWRWVFYINVPIGILCVIGMLEYLPRDKPSPPVRFSVVGFVLLGLGIAAAQIALDRGQGQGWFGSAEIVVEASIAFLAIWFFIVHSATSKRPFISISIFKDSNFVSANILAVMLGVVILSVGVLLPLMMQNVYGLSVINTGLLQAPRGFGSIISMLIVGQLIGRVDTRALLLFGLSAFAANFYLASTFSLDTPQHLIALNGFFQGIATGFLFLPMTTLAFSTIPPKNRGDATSFFTLTRNLGGSAGISIMLAQLATFSITARAALALPYSPGNPNLSSLPEQYNLTDPVGVALLSSEVDRQASMLAYAQVFHLMTIISIVAMPLVFLMRPPKNTIVSQDNIVMEH